jgi:hypothetical protein
MGRNNSKEHFRVGTLDGLGWSISPGLVAGNHPTACHAENSLSIDQIQLFTAQFMVLDQFTRRNLNWCRRFSGNSRSVLDVLIDDYRNGRTLAQNVDAPTVADLNRFNARLDAVDN